MAVQLCEIPNNSELYTVLYTHINHVNLVSVQQLLKRTTSASR